MTPVTAIRQPAWFASAMHNLALIEENQSVYHNSERKAPSAEVFAAVRQFLESCKDENIDEPSLFVSANGHIVLTIGSRPKTLNIRFSPRVSFVLKSAASEPFKGGGMECAIKATLENFKVL